MKLGHLGVAVATTAAVVVWAPGASPSLAQQLPAPQPAARSMPSAIPAANTPAIGDGDVRAIAKVGTTMVIGGGFTTIGGSARNHIAAFNASTGALTSFSPAVNGDVNAVLPGPTANTVYIAGKFTSLANTAVNKVALININTGVVDPTFKAPAIGS